MSAAAAIRVVSPETASGRLNVKMSIDQAAALWFVRPGDVVFDVGCHAGDMSAAYLGRGAVVYGFEPVAATRAAIRPDVRDSPQFHLMPFALGDQNGSAEIIVPARNTGAATLSEAFFRSLSRNAQGGARTEIVDVRRMDDIDLPPARFWKIDTEGAELEVLKGAEMTLAKALPAAVQVEIFPNDPDRYSETLGFLRRLYPHLWAAGITEAGRPAIYDVTPERVSDPHFHAALVRTGTPRYFASSRPARDWIEGARHA